ncbi:MAG: hypothetical protein AB8D78_00765 [Akkermansiaceae bacterium]
MKAPPQIFDSYRAGRSANMADGWTRGMDMSGVSFNDDRTATLVTPRHVVMAKHFARPALSSVVFHDRNGKRLSRKIIALEPGTGDVMVGLLDEAVPSNYTAYPLPVPGSNHSSLVNQRVIVTDQKRCLFVHQVAAVGAGRIAFKQDMSDQYGWGKNLVVGDSGNPAFLIVGKQLVLVETHTTGGAGAGPYYGDPGVQAGVRAAIKKLGGGQRIRTVRVP